MEYNFKVNGLHINASYEQEDINEIFIPLLARWSNLQKEKGRRIFVFLAAPPGCGKTTLSLFLEKLSKGLTTITNLQAIGMDGFHYPNEYLNAHTFLEGNEELLLINRKGSYASFNKELLQNKIIEGRTKNNTWPIYSREIHDVIEDQVKLEEDIILLEGNYLLLNKYGWQNLISFSDDSLYIDALEDELKKRLISRKIQGGMNQSAAQEFYENSEKKNIQTVLCCHHEANVELMMRDNKIMKGAINNEN